MLSLVLPSDIDVVVSSELEEDGVYSGKGQDGDVKVHWYSFRAFRTRTQLSSVVGWNLNTYDINKILTIYLILCEAYKVD